MKRNVVAMSLLVVLLMTGLASGQEPATAPEQTQPKSDLARYAEWLEMEKVRLETELRFAAISADSSNTINGLRIEWLQREVEEYGRKWYEDPKLWFLAGAISYALLMDVQFNVTR